MLFRSTEDFRRIRTSANSARLTRTIVLTMRGLTYTTETVTFYDSLKSFSLRCADHIYEGRIIQKIYGKYISELILSIKILELSQVSLWGYACLLEMTGFRLRRMFFFFFLKSISTPSRPIRIRWPSCRR